ncbi:hypothetical protein J2129_000502 [Methanofollis sp. W23]|uniref:hypothetical protein n=1 Tax=Methanofollis sp. W23 TaxID=2817849 RepID=UPI001AE7B6E6|nr:hypothetical protein [Methanofollis sp. W23]MBP2145048.1 hypothetical protein [Methanofollis sp. W23]
MRPVLFLPVPLALGIGLLSGLVPETLVFSLLYLGVLRLARDWGPDGWLLLFCGGEPLVLVTAEASWGGAVLLQVLVCWAAAGALAQAPSTPGVGEVGVGAGCILGAGALIAALGKVGPALLAGGGMVLLAFFLVWLLERQMRSRLEIGS